MICFAPERLYFVVLCCFITNKIQPTIWTPPRPAPQTPARLLGDLFDIFAVDVACSTPGGNGAYCGVVADDGKAYWWDNVDNGESEVTDPTVRLIDGVNGRVTQLAFGERIGAVLTEKGEVYTLDLRGDGETNLVTGLLSSRRVVQIACGSTYYCALTDTHDLYTSV